MMRGRQEETAALREALAAVRTGRSRVLVLRGEPGIGKTALLDGTCEDASDFRCLRASGVEAEVELAFASLQQLCAPLIDQVDCLPAPQRDALTSAFGLVAGGSPDRFLVGLAVLGLLSRAAEERPLLCVIDDAQWLDRSSAQVLTFVARRLAAESVALVFAARDAGAAPELDGLPELAIKPLSMPDARALLDDIVPAPLDTQVREQILAETRGNPLALLELPRVRSPEEIAGGFGAPMPAAGLSARIEESFRQRLQRLPRDTQRLLLVAAAEPSGDLVLLREAVARLGVSAEASAPAEADGLIQLHERVTFRHSLVRTAIYRGATPGERRTAHRALAEAIDPEADPERRVWHLATATPLPDADVADELERCAARARVRGGLPAAAAFLARAAALTPDPARRAARTIDAAEAKLDGGAASSAADLLDKAEAGPLDDLLRSRLALMRARIAQHLHPGAVAASLHLIAARALEPLDPPLARSAYLEALQAAVYADSLGNGGLRQAAEAVFAGPPTPQPPGMDDLLLDGLALLITDGYAAGAPALRRAVQAFRGSDEQRWLGLASYVAAGLLDDDAMYELTVRRVHLARTTGALWALPIALTQFAGLHCLHAGDLAAAAAALEEADAITLATGSPRHIHGHLVLAGWRGREPEAVALFRTARQQAEVQGEGVALSVAAYAAAILHNGLGEYRQALTAAQAAQDGLDLMSVRVLSELVEAAARCEETGLGAAALARIRAQTQASGTEWALGIEAHAAALLSDGHAAEDRYREAIERLARSRGAAHVARAHLVFGEWLRRRRRRVEAREHLRIALDRFEAMGAEAFAARAARELLATGERARRRTVETLDDLTGQEAQVASLARGGLSNPEIGAQLFISPRTVEYHLRKVFSKLSITSRAQLEHALPTPGLVRSGRENADGSR